MFQNKILLYGRLTDLLRYSNIEMIKLRFTKQLKLYNFDSNKKFNNSVTFPVLVHKKDYTKKKGFGFFSLKYFPKDCCYATFALIPCKS